MTLRFNLFVLASLMAAALSPAVVVSPSSSFSQIKSKRECLFKDMYFLVRGFDEEEYNDIKSLVSAYGGVLFRTIEPNQVLPYVHYTIAPHGWTIPAAPNSTAGPTDEAYYNPDNLDQFSTKGSLITISWLERCIEEGKLLDPSSFILFSPLPTALPFPDTNKERVVITGFKDSERKSLKMLIIMLGFLYRDKLTPKAKILVCKDPVGPKCAFARIYNISVVNQSWIFECAKAGRILPLTAFRIPSSKLPQNSELASSFIGMTQKKPLLLGATLYISKSVKYSRNAIQQLAASLGAGISLKLNDGVTHVLHSGKENNELKTSKCIIVSPMWLSACKQRNVWLDEKEYPCSLNPRMALGITTFPLQTFSSSNKKRAFSLPADRAPPPKKKQKTVISLFREREESECSLYQRPESKKNVKKIKSLYHSDSSLDQFADFPSEPYSFEIDKKTNIRPILFDITSKNTNIDVSSPKPLLSVSLPIPDLLPTNVPEMKIEDENVVLEIPSQYLSPSLQLDNNYSDSNSLALQESLQSETVNAPCAEYSFIDYEANQPSPSPEEMASPSQDENTVQTKQTLSELEKLLSSAPKSKSFAFPGISSLSKEVVSCSKENSVNKCQRFSLVDLERCTQSYLDKETFGDLSDTESVVGSEEEAEPLDSQIVVYNTVQDIPNRNEVLRVQEKESITDIARICDVMSNAPESNLLLEEREIEGKRDEIVIQEASPEVQESNYVFAFTVLSLEMKQDFLRIVRQLGGSVVENEKDFGSITHVIAGKLMKSSKVLIAIAGGKWVLQSSYLDACRAAGSWCDEHPHEWNEQNLPDKKEPIFSAPRRWRRIIFGSAQAAFAGMRIALWLDSHKDVFKIILERGRGVVIASSPPYEEHILDQLTHVIVDYDVTQKHNRHWIETCSKRGIECIAPLFISDRLVKYPPPHSTAFLVRSKSQ